MSRYLVDTDTLTLYQRGHAAVCRRVAERPASEVSVAVISVEEQLTGWYTRLRKAKSPPELAAVYDRFTLAIRFLAEFDLVSFSESAIIQYQSLRKSHRSLGKNDLRIAAIALELGFTVVTRNGRDFRQVPGLVVEDWSQ
jgi:tRNA(fMet)-specific endonuclease VapC